MTSKSPSMYASLIAGLALISSVLSTTAVAGPAIQSWQTSNGARVLFVAAPELPMVDLRIVFDAGSARDNGLYGLAQMSNGMLSEGAGGRSADQILERFAEFGASFGAGALRDMAWVSIRSITDRTHLDPVIENLALLLTQPEFPAPAFERERKRMLIGLQNQLQSAGAIAGKAYFKALYADHPYASPSEGSKESLAKLSRDALKAFHTRYYVGNNAVIAIVGALSRKEAKDLAEAAIGGLPKGERAEALDVVPSRSASEKIVIDFPGSQTHLLLGQPGMSRTDPDYIALYLGNHALGGSGLVSLLSGEIREKRGLTYSVYSYFSPMRVAGPFTAGLQTRNEKAPEALEVLRDTIRTYIKNGPTKEQLAASKKNITGGFPLRIDSNKKIVEYLSLIGFYGLPLDYLDTFSDRIEALTLAQVTDAMRRRIDVDTMLTVVVGTQPGSENGQTKTSSKAE